MTCIADLSAAPEDWVLESVLHRALCCPGGNGTGTVALLGRRRSEYSSSYTIEELDLLLPGGGRLELIFKDLSWGSLLQDARAVRPRFIYDPRREILTYQRILAARHMGTPRLVAAVSHSEADRHWLFLERVNSQKLCHVGDFATWEAAARWLGQFHQQHRERRPGKRALDHLLKYDAEFYAAWIDRAIAIREDQSPGGPQLELLRRLRDRYDEVVKELLHLPVTLIHGEYYASNILVQQNVGTLRICPVDWELAAYAPGLMDLAALTSGSWNEAQRTRLEQAYDAALHDAGSSPYSCRDFSRGLDLCRLHLAVQWIGWSAHWTPPADQAQNWLGEASRLANKLNVI